MSKYYEIVKLYNDGITDYEEISKKLNISINTVKSYLTKARKEGAIEKKRKKIENTEYEQLIKIYKSGITDYDEISNQLYIPKGTVTTYISRAKKEGKIEKTNEKKGNSKYEKIIELYKSGITDYEEIAQKTNSTYRTVMSYLSKAKKEGIIEKNRKVREDTKYEQVIELYKSGVIDYRKISEKLNVKKSTVSTYISNAKKEGKIENNRTKKINLKYEQTIELYRSGITDYEEIMQKTNLSYDKVVAYLSKANREGRIEKNRKARTNTKYEQVVEIYKKGTTDYIEIAEKLNISINTARSYLTRIRNEEALKNKKEQEEKANNAKKEEREAIIKKLKQIPLYREIILNAKNKNITPTEELNQMIMGLNDPLKRIQLAQICFLLNNIKVTQVVLNTIISSTSINENIKKMAIEEKNKIIRELKARQNINTNIKDGKVNNSEIEK